MLGIDLGPGDLERARENRLASGTGMPALDMRDGRVEIGIRERGDLRGAQLDVIEPDCLRRCEVLQSHGDTLRRP